MSTCTRVRSQWSGLATGRYVKHQFELKSFRALGVAFFGGMAPSPLNLHKNAAANMLRYTESSMEAVPLGFGIVLALAHTILLCPARTTLFQEWC